MEFLIVSGLSGGGKSRAMDILEDLNYYCVDNMPLALIPKFAELCLASQNRYEKVALATDVREKQGARELIGVLDELVETRYKILFVEADSETIVRRYKETRRRHPLALEGGSLESAVREEIRLMEPIRDRADYIVNTGGFTLSDLQSEIYEIFFSEKNRSLLINIISFGFKHGIPLEADLVFDVRFLPNPFYIPELRGLTGVDKPVYEYVFESEATAGFLERLNPMMEFLIPLYLGEGKYSLTVAIGCTGGRHRSVAVAVELAKGFEDCGQRVRLTHRDINK